MLNTVPTSKCAVSQLSLTVKFENLHYNVEIGNNGKGSFVDVSLLKQQRNSDSEFISVRFWPLRSVIYITNMQFRLNHMIKA